MLSLVITKQLKRKTAAEKLRLCRSEKIIKEAFSTLYGDITLYTVYHYTKKPFFTTEKMQKALNEELFAPNTKIPKEYLIKAILEELIENLKSTHGKTVCLKKEFCYSALLDQICRYAKRVYTMSPVSEERICFIYKTYGTLPIFSKQPIAADYCPDILAPITVTLPQELEEIRPKEFSPLLFAALIYKKNGKFLK